MFKIISLTILLAMLSPFSFADTIWLDVRTVGEFNEQSIDGSINIPHTKIRQYASQLLIDKQANINVYCRSGRRSGMALKLLNDMGYEKVKNIGSIGDAQKLKNNTLYE